MCGFCNSRRAGRFRAFKLQIRDMNGHTLRIFNQYVGPDTRPFMPRRAAHGHRCCWPAQRADTAKTCRQQLPGAAIRQRCGHHLKRGIQRGRVQGSPQKVRRRLGLQQCASSHTVSAFYRRQQPEGRAMAHTGALHGLVKPGQVKWHSRVRQLRHS